MNKKLIALAVAAAIAPAAAMADSGNVTIYGQANASFDHVSFGNYTTNVGALDPTGASVSGASSHRISDNASRLGFKGTEDLGNGLNAVWQMEAAINLDDGTGGAFSRNSYVGLSSKTAGTVLLGRHDTPYKLATRGLDKFGDTVGDTRSIMGGGANSAASITSQEGVAVLGSAVQAGQGATNSSAGNTSFLNFDGRQSNVLAYISPTISGMHAAIGYVAAAETPASSAVSKASAWSLAGIYDNGPLFASLAYETHKAANTLVAGTAQGFAAGTSATEKAWKLGLGYKMAAFDVAFAYEKTSDNAGDLDMAAGGKNATFSDVLGHKAYQLGAGYTFGSNKVKLQYVKADKTNAARENDVDDSAKQWSLGFDHNMSKRTRLYAVYSKLDNAASGSYSIVNGGNGSAGNLAAQGLGQDSSVWSLGMKHSF